jgi:hypothetical protein
MICTGESYREKLKLTFPKGGSIDDPTGLFNAGGGARRAIDIEEDTPLDDDAFVALVQSAVAVNRG